MTKSGNDAWMAMADTMANGDELDGARQRHLSLDVSSFPHALSCFGADPFRGHADLGSNRERPEKAPGWLSDAFQSLERQKGRLNCQRAS